MKFFSQKKVLIRLLRISGLPLLIRLLFQKKRVTVIYYHNIDAENFDLQVEYLIRKYNIISVDTLADYLYNRIEQIPPYSLLISFDDGHSANYKLLDIVKKYAIKPTIFLTANQIGTSKPFWFNLPFKKVDEKDWLKTLADEDRIQYLIKNYSLEMNTPVKQSLTWNEVKEMTEFISFQSHTLDHPCLPNCSKDSMITEIVNSKIKIEENLSKTVFAIAYPNGDFTQREIVATKNAGYLLGFSSIPGFVTKKSNPYSIRRLSMNDTKDLDDFILRHTGVWFILKKMLLIVKHPWKLLIKEKI